uniref:RING-type domain-containing protein n=1 Tax=Fagus sylvatica TaxID=28930 RepID=A0A2N9HES2_FAGSY
MAPGSRGVGVIFVHFSDEDSGQTGDAIGEPRVPRRSWSRYLSNAPGLADQLVASRKDSAREGGFPDVRFRRSWYRRKACIAYFCKVPDLRKSELGLVRYGPANRGHRSVFGPFEGSFPIRIPARPGKILVIREFLVVHECVLFPTCPGSRINLLRVRKTLRASVATSVGKFRNFQQNLIFGRPVFTRVVDIAPDVGFRRSWYRRKAYATYFPKVQALHRGELGFARYDPANGGRWSVPYAKGSSQFDSAFGLVNGPVKPWSNLGQTWSNLVKALQTLGNVSRTAFRGFSGIAGPSQVRNGLVKPWSNSVNPGQTSGDVSRIFFLGSFDVASPRRVRPTRLGLSRFACRHPRKSPHLTALLLDTTDLDSDTIVTDAFQNSIIRESMEAFEAKSIRATKSSVEPLEKFRFQQQSDSVSVGECIICLEEFETGSELIRMPCSHVYPGHCVLMGKYTPENPVVDDDLECTSSNLQPNGLTHDWCAATYGIHSLDLITLLALGQWWVSVTSPMRTPFCLSLRSFLFGESAVFDSCPPYKRGQQLSHKMAFGGYNDASNHGHQKKKKIAVIGVSSVLLIAMVAAVAVGVSRSHGSSKANANNKGDQLSTSNKAIKTLCQPTDYKETCEKTLTSAAGNTTDYKQLINAGFQVAVDEQGN